MEFIESRLITLSKNGDQNAFREITEMYRDKIFRMASRILKGSVESDDVVQETFLRFYLSMNRFDESKSLSAWLYRIGKNVCLDILRKRRYDLPLDEPHDEEGLNRHERLPSYEPTPEAAVLQSESRALAAEMIDSLPEKYKPLFIGQYIHGMTLEEISRAVHLPVNTVKSRMNRGRSFLKRKWGSRLLLYITLFTVYIQFLG